MKIRPGVPYPLGATWDGEGVNFALYSEHAAGVDVCLFDENGVERRLPLRERTAFVWHGYVPGLRPGAHYGFRVKGEYAPEKGLRFNEHAVLLDPYAKAVAGPVDWEKGAFAYELASGDDTKRCDAEILGAPRGIVIDPAFDWEGDRPLGLPLHQMVIYEAHVRGMTMRHPDVPESLRGTFAGLASDPILEHLGALGINGIELLPVHAFVDDKVLLDRALRNYWGYNSIAYLAPEPRYRSRDVPGDGVREFKEMVKRFHRAGIEVILDVVYNHTAEGNHLGPTLSFKGIDNPTYYRLSPEDPRYYFDYTGTGNSLNVHHPQTLQLVMDSLRYWVLEMHVDGFRFDLAATLARTLHEVDQLSSFFTIIHQDPVLSQVKLIAEPWDVGEGGYQVGNFPVRWAEWNGKYRDAMRAFWKGDGGLAGELAYRLSGSSDLYENDGRRPYSSINFVVAHDGFTLRDLVSYDGKHNDANGEGNRDGSDDNRSWNCGAEGPTDDPGIRALRARQQRNLLATLLLSQGTPMICGGDEIGRTQNGNNNAYCQDNETSWIDWALDDERKKLLGFAKRLVRLRADHPALRRAKFFKGRRIRGADIRDILWIRNDGQPMSEEDWKAPITRALGMLIAGNGLDEVNERGDVLSDDDLFLVINGGHEALDFAMPNIEQGAEDWMLLVDTNDDDAKGQVPFDGRTRLEARSLRLYRRRASGQRNSMST
ncbi:MAG TPA: glycogen debranching protein GlgX [Polyangiaceae bacterium]|jgi:glycogen operon protein